MQSTNKELTIVRDFDAPIDLVFKAWTDQELVAQWWGPNGVTNSVRKLDVKPGGAIDIVMLAGDELGPLKGSEWPMTGEYKEITTPTKLVFTSSAIMDGKPILECLVSVAFEENEGKTKMTLNISVTKVTPEAAMALAGMEMGWTQSIDKLSKFLATQ